MKTMNRKMNFRKLLSPLLGLGLAASFTVMPAKAYDGGYYQTPPPQQQQRQLQGRLVYIQAGTPFTATAPRSLSSAFTTAGTRFEAPVSGGSIPPGTTGIFVVTDVSPAGRGKKPGSMNFKLVALRTPDGRTYQASATVDQSIFQLRADGSRAGAVVKDTAKGAAAGALAGLIASSISGGRKGRGTAISTGIGGGLGLLNAGIRKGQEFVLNAGSSIPFVLDSTVQLSVPPPVPRFNGGYSNPYAGGGGGGFQGGYGGGGAGSFQGGFGGQGGGYHGSGGFGNASGGGGYAPPAQGGQLQSQPLNGAPPADYYR